MSKKKARRKPRRTSPMRDGNPSNMANWIIVCSACGAEFQNDESIALVDDEGRIAKDEDPQTHWSKNHPDLENPHVNLVWVGKGPAPRRP